MSDVEVLRLIEEMETLLETDAPAPDPERVAEWHRLFLAACASAERGPGWPGIVQRAHTIAGRVGDLVTALSVQRDGLKREMETQAMGQRALKAYKPGQP